MKQQQDFCQLGSWPMKTLALLCVELWAYFMNTLEPPLLISKLEILGDKIQAWRSEDPALKWL